MAEAITGLLSGQRAGAVMDESRPEPIRAEPPTRENVTGVAYDIRSYWGLGGRIYCPNVCYEVVDGRMRLLRTLEVPDAGSGNKLLFIVKKMHPRNRMSDYRDDICRELRARGVDV